MGVTSTIEPYLKRLIISIAVDSNKTKFGKATDETHIYQITEIVQCTELSSYAIFGTIIFDSRKSYTYIRKLALY